MDVATDEEREEVERWLAEDEGNREYYRKAKRYFETYYTGEETRVVAVSYTHLTLPPCWSLIPVNK